MALTSSNFGIRVYGARAAARKLITVAFDTRTEIYKAMQKSLIILEAQSKRLIKSGYYRPAIDTGVMWNSITNGIVVYTKDLIVGEVGARVKYAIYVHEGTWFMEKRPFFHDALVDKKKEVRLLIRSAILGAGIKNQRFVTGSKIQKNKVY